MLTLAAASLLPVASTITVTSSLALSGVTAVTITTPQATTLPGNAALSADKKTITITPSAALPYATTLTVTVRATANGIEGTVTGTVLTESAPVAIVCPSPSVKHLTMNACIYPIAVQKSMPPNELSPAIASVNSSAFLTTTVNGESLLIDTGDKLTSATNVADRNREIVYSIYRYGGFYVKKPLFKDTLRGIYGNDGLLQDGLVSVNVADRFMGVSNGLLYRGQPGNICYLAASYGSGFGVVDSTACPVWN